MFGGDETTKYSLIKQTACVIQFSGGDEAIRNSLISIWFVIFLGSSGKFMEKIGNSMIFVH